MTPIFPGMTVLQLFDWSWGYAISLHFQLIFVPLHEHYELIFTEINASQLLFQFLGGRERAHPMVFSAYNWLWTQELLLRAQGIIYGASNHPLQREAPNPVYYHSGPRCCFQFYLLMYLFFNAKKWAQGFTQISQVL